MTKLFQTFGFAILLSVGVSAFAEERCLPGTRCLSPLPVYPTTFDANYVCRTTSDSGRGYPVSYRLGDRYICQDLGYGADYRAWPGGNHTGNYVCCFDPYAR